MSNKKELRHLAVIPARGGSKRLPRKNIVEFFGKPIIGYTIAAAHDAKIFSRVLVSTEDAEIAKISAGLGAEIDRRPPELSTDAATVGQVCLELLERLERENERYDTLTVLYATAPLRNSADIRATHALLKKGECDFSMAVTPFDQPVHQALRPERNGELVPVFPDLVAKRASAVPAFLSGNGSTYSVDVEAFRRVREFYGYPLKGHIMPAERSVDIDTENDLALAKIYGSKFFAAR